MTDKTLPKRVRSNQDILPQLRKTNGLDHGVNLEKQPIALTFLFSVVNFRKRVSFSFKERKRESCCYAFNLRDANIYVVLTEKQFSLLLINICQFSVFMEITKHVMYM